MKHLRHRVSAAVLAAILGGAGLTALASAKDNPSSPPRGAPRQQFAFRVLLPAALDGFAMPFPQVQPLPPGTATPAATATKASTATASPTPAPSITPSPTPVPGPAWLAYVNMHRIAGGVATVAEDPALSEGARLHSVYMVKNDAIGHTEASSNRWYTPQGAEAARRGNVYGSSRMDTPFQGPIDAWMTGPFHQLGIIDPLLEATGYGDYNEDVGRRVKFAATINVLSARTRDRGEVAYPVMYPADGQVMPNLAYWGNESPDPLASCAGYSAPTGAPIAIQLGAGNVTPKVRRTVLRQGQTELPHCTFDETNYASSLGRAVLKMRSAIIIMAKAPLRADTEYQVELETNGQTYSWRFHTAAP